MSIADIVIIVVILACLGGISSYKIKGKKSGKGGCGCGCDGCSSAACDKQQEQNQ